MGWSRREFLQRVAGSATILSLVPPLLARSAPAGDSTRQPDDSVLVVIQLTGGNDGLNTVVPYGDDQYAAQRPTIHLSPRELHKIDSHLGFHPRMQALWQLYREGSVSIVQGVGYPNPDSNHPEAMRIWHTGRPHDAICQTGWLGRAVDDAHGLPDAAVPAVSVGLVTRPLAMNAEKVTISSVHSASDWVLRRAPPRREDDMKASLKQPAMQPPDDANPAMAFATRAIAAAHVGSRKVQASLQSTPSRNYPPFQLAQRLRTIADLIRADVGVRIYFTELGGEGFGGFDNHANQLGNHCALLHQLSESLAAFALDLRRQHLLDRVLVMTFSEFGRTVRENGRRGTDHGAAAPVLLIGGRLRSGLVGNHPSLTDLEPNGGFKHHLDFRRVYATILDGWLNYPSKPVLGEAFEPLELFQDSPRPKSGRGAGGEGGWS